MESGILDGDYHDRDHIIDAVLVWCVIEDEAMVIVEVLVLVVRQEPEHTMVTDVMAVYHNIIGIVIAVIRNERAAEIRAGTIIRMEQIVVRIVLRSDHYGVAEIRIRNAYPTCEVRILCKQVGILRENL
jgi:hypothetical protein